MNGVLTARTPEQARLLQEVLYAGLLGRQMKSDASAGEVAKDTSQTLQQLHLKLTRLLQDAVDGLHHQFRRDICTEGQVTRDRRPMTRGSTCLPWLACRSRKEGFRV